MINVFFYFVEILFKYVIVNCVLELILEYINKDVIKLFFEYEMLLNFVD